MRAIMFFILSFSFVVEYKYSKKVKKRAVKDSFDYFRQIHVYCPRPQGGDKVHGVDGVLTVNFFQGNTVGISLFIFPNSFTIFVADSRTSLYTEYAFGSPASSKATS